MFERTKPKISIVIPSWFVPGQDGRYGKAETFVIAEKCLQRLMEVTTEDCEIIIIDNGSTLSDVDYYWKKAADILIRNKENLGFGPAMDQGTLLARGKYIVFLNNDIYIWDNFFNELVKVFHNKKLDPPPGAVMPNLIKKHTQSNCLREDGKLDSLKAMDLKKEEINLPHRDRIEEKAEFGSAFMMKKELVDEIIKKDGFLYDPQFVGFFSEDRDLWKRIRLMGFETYRTNQLRIVHVGNISISKVPDRKKYSEKNRERLKEKWKNK